MTLKFWQWFGRITIEQRARAQLADIERRLFDAKSSQSLWNHQVDYLETELYRLQTYVDPSEDRHVHQM